MPVRSWLKTSIGKSPKINRSKDLDIANFIAMCKLNIKPFVNPQLSV
jgi:hypothetical protein